MRNPFTAIGNAIANAGKAVASTVTRATQAVSRAVTAPFQRQERAAKPAAPPAAPPAKQAPTPPAAPPAKQAPTPPAAPTGGTGGKQRKLPPTDFGPGSPSVGRDIARDDRILGVDSDAEKLLTEAIKDFEANYKTSILGESAKGFIEHPTFSQIFDKYSTGSGWSSDQWFNGANNIRDIQITRKPGGKIEILFDADFVIDGDDGGSGDIGARTVSAVF